MRSASESNVVGTWKLHSLPACTCPPPAQGHTARTHQAEASDEATQKKDTHTYLACRRRGPQAVHIQFLPRGPRLQRAQTPFQVGEHGRRAVLEEVLVVVVQRDQVARPQDGEDLFEVVEVDKAVVVCKSGGWGSKS